MTLFPVSLNCFRTAKLMLKLKLLLKVELGYSV